MGVRGYVKYEPKAERAHWIAAVKAVLVEFKDEWPLTIRQIFYRVVAAYDYPKTEQAYNALVDMIARSRRSHLIDQRGIPFAAIRDGGLSQSKPVQLQFKSEDDYHEQVRDWTKRMTLDRQAGQDRRVELWCEAGGMVPILQRVGNVYGARVTTGGGYDSLTIRQELAERVLERSEQGFATVICHVGDFDPSGENMCQVLDEDVGTMVYQLTGSWEWLEVKRVALTEQQVIERNVITAPPKPSDSRMVGFIRRHPDLVDHLGTTDIAAQLEALTPPELRVVLAEAVEAELDLDVYQAVLAEEAEIRERLLGHLGGDDGDDEV